MSDAQSDRPLSRVMACPVCGPVHEWHLMPCDRPDCDCTEPPIPGVYTN